MQAKGLSGTVQPCTQSRVGECVIMKQPYIKIPKYTDSELALMFDQAVLLQRAAEEHSGHSVAESTAYATRSIALSNLIIAQKLLWVV